MAKLCQFCGGGLPLHANYCTNCCKLQVMTPVGVPTLQGATAGGYNAPIFKETEEQGAKSRAPKVPPLQGVPGNVEKEKIDAVA